MSDDIKSDEVMMTGTEVHILFTFDDGSQARHGSWVVPHDSEYAKTEQVGSDLGWNIVYMMAKQPERTVVRCEVVRGSASDGASDAAAELTP